MYHYPKTVMKSLTLYVLLLIVCLGTITLTGYVGDTPKKIPPTGERLRLVQDQKAQTISVFRGAGKTPILVQNAKADFRPFIHPIMAPDGKGVLTQYSPGHHKHQTGLYWGYTRVNGRDYFHHPQGDYWRRKSAKVLTATGPTVKWETVYDLLDSTGKAVLTETQIWSMRSVAGQFRLDLEWQGEAQTDVTIGKYDYGGLFLRMPWREGINGEVINAARQRNAKAEGQRAMWVDVGMQVEGRQDLAHIAIFDHPENKGYPQTWRVDNQLGIGPARARTGDWTIKKGDTEVIRHQLVVYTGVLNDVELTKTWSDFSGKTSMYSTADLWAIAQREGRDAKFLSPDEAVKVMTVMLALLPGHNQPGVAGQGAVFGFVLHFFGISRNPVGGVAAQRVGFHADAPVNLLQAGYVLAGFFAVLHDRVPNLIGRGRLPTGFDHLDLLLLGVVHFV